MQYVDRGTEPPPKILTGSVAKMLRGNLLHFMEDSADRRSQRSPPSGSLDFRQGGMQEALNRLFKGRCAFCESISETNAWQFRATGEAQPYAKSEYAHLYYCWLELAWQNFYPICLSCTPKERGYFPVIGSRGDIPDLDSFRRYARNDNGLWPPASYPPRESPLLIDPCQDRNIYKYISIGMDGMIRSGTKRGVATIEHFNLNAEKLIDARRKKHSDSLLSISRFLQHNGGDRLPDHLFQFDDQEYGGTWYILLRRLASAMAQRSGSKPELSLAKIGEFIRKQCSARNGFQLFSNSERDLEREDLSQSRIRPRVPPQRPSQARLVGIEIENFKSLEYLELAMPIATDNTRKQASAPALLVLGENGAGKSSILEAIALALAPTAAHKKLGIKEGDLILSPDHFGDLNIPPRIEAKVKVTFSDGEGDLYRMLHIGARQINTSAKEREARVPVFAYGAFRKYGTSYSRTNAISHIQNLFNSKDLANPEKWLLSLSDDRFAMAARALRNVFSVDGDFEVISKDSIEDRCFLITAVDGEQKPASRIPLRMASSGFRSVLAMMCDIMRGLMSKSIYSDFESLSTARGVVLIDEIEAHLHPRWKMSIIRAIRQTLPGMTFIFTTHDPLCIRGMGDGEVAVIRRTRLEQGTTKGGLRTAVEILNDLPSASMYGIEQLLTSDLFQLNSTDDPEIDKHMDDLARLLGSSELNSAELHAVERFKREISSAMPVGTSEAQRVVQEAVAEYLQGRAQNQVARLSQERARVKKRIIHALRGID